MRSHLRSFALWRPQPRIDKTRQIGCLYITSEPFTLFRSFQCSPYASSSLSSSSWATSARSVSSVRRLLGSVDRSIGLSAAETTDSFWVYAAALATAGGMVGAAMCHYDTDLEAFCDWKQPFEETKYSHPSSSSFHGSSRFFPTPFVSRTLSITLCDNAASTVPMTSSSEDNADDSNNTDTTTTPGGETTLVLEDVDPYENLPNEDEETTCVICNTYRKGPCRPFWRKLEYCVNHNHTHDNNGQGQDKDNGKNNEQEEDPCSPYAIPFYNCLFQYYNLYYLVHMDMFQSELNDVLRESTPIDPQRKKIALLDDVVEIQWDDWIHFVKEKGVDFKQSIRRYHTTQTQTHDNDNAPSSVPASDSPPLSRWERVWNLFNAQSAVDADADASQSSSIRSLLPLWERFPENLEPVLPKLSLKLHPQEHQQDNRHKILQVAYVVDQDGFLLGLYHSKNEATDESSSQSEKKKDSDMSNSTEKDSAKSPAAEIIDDSNDTTEFVVKPDNENGNDDVEIKFVVVPGETQSIRIYALYVVKDSDSARVVVSHPEHDNELVNVMLCMSRDYPIPKSEST